MVRRDATTRGSRQGNGSEVARCASPAGESPVPVSAGAPGSRPQASGETPASERGVKSLQRGDPGKGASTRAATSSEACSLDR